MKPTSLNKLHQSHQEQKWLNMQNAVLVFNISNDINCMFLFPVSMSFIVSYLFHHSVSLLSMTLRDPSFFFLTI